MEVTYIQIVVNLCILFTIIAIYFWQRTQMDMNKNQMRINTLQSKFNEKLTERIIMLEKRVK